MDLGNKESYDCWLEFLRNMINRGLKVLVSITTDGAPRLTKTVDEIWLHSLRIRCWVHKMANVLDKIPEKHKSDVNPFLAAERDAPDYQPGCQKAKELIDKYKKISPGR